MKNRRNLLVLALYQATGRSQTRGTCIIVILSRRQTSLYQYLNFFKILLSWLNGVRVLVSVYYLQCSEEFEKIVVAGRAILSLKMFVLKSSTTYPKMASLAHFLSELQPKKR